MKTDYFLLINESKNIPYIKSISQIQTEITNYILSIDKHIQHKEINIQYFLFHLRFHILITISLPEVARIPYLWWNLTVEMKCSWASTFFFYFPYVKSHTLKVLSSEAVYRYLPVGWIANPLTQLSCPTKLYNSSPVCAKNNLTSLSREAVKIKVCW